MENMFLKLI